MSSKGGAILRVPVAAPSHVKPEQPRVTKVLRTPDERFANLPDFDYEPHYTVVPRGEGESEGLRIHHVEAGPEDGPVVLLMHGQPTWSFLYRRMIPVLVKRGCG